MTTALFILQGEFRGRHYDRLEDEPEHMIVTPTIMHAKANELYG